MFFDALNEMNNERKRLDDEAVDSLFAAADQRKPVPTEIDVIEAIKRRNSYRYWRLQHDLKWFRKELRRLGYSPDDAGEFL